jgi:two-component system, NarL family, response regulator DevR
MNAPPDTAGQIRVYLVEDHPVVAEGLSSLLGDYPDLSVVGVAGSVAEVAAPGRPQADVAVIDYYLPDGTGAEAADIIRASPDPAAIVFLTADDSDWLLIEAVEAGASGYLLKSSSGEEIVRTILAAAAGQTVLPTGSMASALSVRRQIVQQRNRQKQLLASLTSREKEILALMINGADNRAISEALHISYATVRSHVRSILAKLGAHSQLDAVAKGRQLPLEEPDSPSSQTRGQGADGQDGHSHG